MPAARLGGVYCGPCQRACHGVRTKAGAFLADAPQPKRRALDLTPPVCTELAGVDVVDDFNPEDVVDDFNGGAEDAELEPAGLCDADGDGDSELAASDGPEEEEE